MDGDHSRKTPFTFQRESRSRRLCLNSSDVLGTADIRPYVIRGCAVMFAF